jgi:hypothetical protein
MHSHIFFLITYVMRKYIRECSSHRTYGIKKNIIAMLTPGDIDRIKKAIASAPSVDDIDRLGMLSPSSIEFIDSREST